jgi:hypothetical protein
VRLVPDSIGAFDANKIVFSSRLPYGPLVNRCPVEGTGSRVRNGAILFIARLPCGQPEQFSNMVSANAPVIAGEAVHKQPFWGIRIEFDGHRTVACRVSRSGAQNLPAPYLALERICNRAEIVNHGAPASAIIPVPDKLTGSSHAAVTTAKSPFRDIKKTLRRDLKP